MTDASGHDHHRPARVLVLWNHSDDAEAPEPVVPERAGRGHRFEAVVNALQNAGCPARAIDIEDDIGRLRDALTVVRPELVLDLIDHYRGDTTQHAAVVALLELLGAPVVGSSAMCLANCQDRVRARVALAHDGVTTPGFRIVRDGNAIPDTAGLRAPMIVTQAYDDIYVKEGQSQPLADRAQVLAQCARLLPEYELPFLIEEYIVARRLHVVVLGNRVLDVLPIVEATGGAADDHPAWQLAQLDPDTLVRVRDLARRAYRVLDCRDFAQLDINLDERGQPHVIDIRPMVDMGEGSVLWAAASFTDRSPGQTLMALLGHARERWAGPRG